MATIQTETTDSYPFLTERVDGELRTGIAFCPQNGRFYEAVPHDDAEAKIDVRCPRTGERKQWNGVISQTMATVVGGWIFAQYPAEKWANKREMYVEADEHKQGQWEELWCEISDEQ